MENQDTLDQFVAKKAEDGLTKQERIDISKQTKKLKGVNVNLSYARMAVSYVKQKVKLVANWDERLDKSAEGIFRIGISKAKSPEDQNRVIAASKAAWNKADQCVYGNLRQNNEWQRINNQDGGVQNLRDIEILADLASQYGCGNCGELTAMAFMYLYHLEIRPLDFMTLESPADHAFVVIGRKESNDYNRVSNWGKSAVVCDPWGSGLIGTLAYSGRDLLPSAFGDSYAAYSAELLEKKMKAMHPNFSGVMPAHREE